MSTKRHGLHGAAGLLLLATGGAALLQAGTIYVTPTGTDSAGANWNTPTSLTNALAIATTNGSAIWLAQGTYMNTATFTVPTNCALYGGFTNGGSLADRDWNAYPAILDGQAAARRVVTVNGTNVTLDGLVITNSTGGGITKTVAGSLTLANCRIVRNSLGSSGAGGYFTAGTILMTNCVVASNTVTTGSQFGFGIYSSSVNLQLVDCLFSNQYGDAFNSQAGKGLALYFNNGTATVVRTDFIGNAGCANVTGGGGAVYLGNNANMSASFSNCVFRGNVAGQKYANGYGGAMWVDLAAGKTVTVANCTFKDNRVDLGYGGAIYVSGGTLILKNSILWTNTVVVGSGYLGSEIYVAGGAVQIGYSCLGGLTIPSLYGITAGNMSSVMTNNPLFASATDLHLKSPAGRWQNGSFVTTDTAFSPCIDAGDPADSVGSEPVENGSRIDLGAYGGTTQASMSPNAAPQVADLGVGLNYTIATFSGQLANASAVIAVVGLCYGTNSVPGNTTNGWQYVSQLYPPQQTGCVFSAVTPYPYLLTNTTYYYQWYATNGYGASWTTVSNFTVGVQYPPGWGVGGGSNVIHVKKDAVGGGNGSDWYNAYTTIAGGCAALSGSRTNIWIAGGVYAEGVAISVATNFTMIGGFAGTETNAADRALTNAQGVVTNYNASLNGEGTHGGLNITAGNAWMDTLVFSNCSGHALNKSSAGALTMNNCSIVRNSGGLSGAGGYFTAGTILMTNCVVASNTVTTSSLNGFGIYSVGANLQLVDCVFSNQYGDALASQRARGVALYFDNGTASVLRTDFTGNSGGANVTGGGGAVYLGNNANMSASFCNCVFRGNVAGQSYATGSGGAMWADLGAGKTVTVANCTFKDNRNDNGNGGAIYVSGGTLILKNSILWTNSVTSSYTGREIYRAGGAVQIGYSCLGGLTIPSLYGITAGNMSSVMTNNPLFASASDLHLKSPAGRWQNGSFVTTDTAYSPCIDAGDPADPVGAEPVENGSRIDLGAYGGTAQASMSPNAPPQVADLGVGLNYTIATFSGQLANASAVIAVVGICYGTNSVPGNTTNGWQTVGQLYPPQQTGTAFSVASPYPYLLTNTTYYYQWYATNAYGASWTTVSNFTTGASYPPGWGVGGGSNVIHVKKDAPGAANGQDWYNAYTTIAGGYAAVSGARSNIWIAGGVYSEGVAITIGTNLTMIGGFAGTETSTAGRALTNAQGAVTNYTSLNGEGAHGCLNITAGNVWLDTLVFSNSSGHALGSAGTLTINNCRIVRNTGAANGPGGYFTAGTVLMTNCVVASNTVTTSSLNGFGIYSSGANLQLVDCVFSNQYGDVLATQVGKGMALYFNNGTLRALRTDFIGNSGGTIAGGGGGAVYLGNNANMSVSFSNCVFRGNVAPSFSPPSYPGYGGAIWMDMAAGKTAAVVNCAFKDNLNDSSDGGAIYVSGGTLILRNSILWTNSVRGGLGFAGSEIFATNVNSLVINSYTCFTGTNTPYVVAKGSAVVQWGPGAITNNPLYASATDVHLKSKGGRFDPATATWVNDTATSPCIDAGDPADPVGLEPMPNGHRIDMGAYGGTAQASKTVPKGAILILK